MESEGRKIHGLALHAREKSDFIDSLKLSDEAMVAYQEANDSLGFAEIQADRALTLRHLASKTGDQNYLILAKYSAMAGVEIAEKSDDKTTLAIPLFNLAKVQEELNEISTATNNYKKAINCMTNNPPEIHNRPAIIADFKLHLATCEFKSGDKSAIERALIEIANIQNSTEVTFNKAVWASGGYMKLAEILKVEDLSKAKEYLQKAKVIIDANSDLKLRKEQWEKLAQTFQ